MAGYGRRGVERRADGRLQRCDGRTVAAHSRAQSEKSVGLEREKDRDGPPPGRNRMVAEDRRGSIMGRRGHGLRLAVGHADTTTGHRHARPSCLGTTCVSSRHTDRPSTPSPSRSQKKKACGEHDRAVVSVARGRVSFKPRRPPGAVYLPAWAREPGRADCRTVARRAAARAASSGASPAAWRPAAPSGNRAVVWTTRSGSTPTRL